MFYKMGRSALDIPDLSETITVDEYIHVKLLPIRNFGDLGNNLTDADKIPSSNLEELQRIHYKKSFCGPKFSAYLLRYAALLYYTSTQDYQLLLQQFPLP